MNKNKAFALFGVLILFIAVVLILVLSDQEAGARTFEQCAAEGNPVMESYPRQCRFPDGTLVVEVIDGGSGSSASSLSQANIVVSEPQESDRIANPLTISGQARVFENAFNYRVLDADGTVLMEGHSMADAPDIGQFGPFEVEARYALPKGDTGWVEVFEYSAKDGSEINKVRIPVEFADAETTTVKIFLGHETADPNAPCDEVYGVERTVPKTTSVAMRALEELVKGPMETESDEAMFSALPEGVNVLSVTINNGVARAVFSPKLNEVAGSCRVQAIRAQIEETLLQFPTVTSVQIAVQGVPDEEVLQP
ncbi:GerMN domain-containing protein [Candidatus Peregrinibacteria bacterium]|nr:GerMN domain-containing protein [Candidatus Peregrinibacteria bacterium]